jgi:hypothetical protein
VGAVSEGVGQMRIGFLVVYQPWLPIWTLWRRDEHKAACVRERLRKRHLS